MTISQVNFLLIQQLHNPLLLLSHPDYNLIHSHLYKQEESGTTVEKNTAQGEMGLFTPSGLLKDRWVTDACRLYLYVC